MAEYKELKIEYRDISTLIPFKRNPKTHPDVQVANLARSIEKFGWRNPVLINAETGEIVAGHGRILAAKKLGITSVPTIDASDMTDEQIDQYRYLDNKLAESPWDVDILADDLMTLNFSDFDLEWECLGNLTEEEEPMEVEDDEFDESDVSGTRVKRGDIWQCGNHRLLCGDSTSAEDVARLMDGQKAKLLFTSPPYSDMREYNGEKDLSVSNLVDFIPAYKEYAALQCVNLGIQVKNHEVYPYWNEYIDKARECGYLFVAWNVWDKCTVGSIGQQKAFVPIRHEWIFLFSEDGERRIKNTWSKKDSSIRERGLVPRRQADGSMKRTTAGDCTGKYKPMESVVQVLPELRNEVRKTHPAPFSVQLPAEYIQAFTDVGDSVIEPFCGSGKTMIACEQLERRCYGMELDENYCEVILSRWEKATGREAVLVSRLS